MKRLKRGVAVFLSILMIFTAFPVINASAAGDVVENDNPNFAFTYHNIDQVSGNYYYDVETNGDSFTATFTLGSTLDPVNYNVFARYNLTNGTSATQNLDISGENVWSGNTSSITINGLTNVASLSFYIASPDGFTTYYTSSKTFSIDLGAPVTTAVAYAASDTERANPISYSGYVNSDSVLVFTVTDNNFVPADGQITPSAIGVNYFSHNCDRSATDALAAYISTPGNWSKNSETGNWELTYSVSEEREYIVSFIATDVLNKTSEESNPSINFRIDKSAPVVEAKAKTSIGTRLLNAITFGLYKTDAETTVTVTDDPSGVKTAQYKLVPEGTQDPSTITYTDLPSEGAVTITPQFKGYLYVYAEDNAGNSKEYVSNVDNGMLIADDNDAETTADPSVGGILVDSLAPATASDDYKGELNTTATNATTVGDVTYYKAGDAVTYTVTTTEANFNVNPNATDEIVTDSTVVAYKDGSATPTAIADISGAAVVWSKGTGENEYTATVTIPATEDNQGEYTIETTFKDALSASLTDEATDDAKHIKVVNSPAFVIDTEAPAFVSDEFVNYENSKNDVYYFSNDNTAEYDVYVTDPHFNTNTAASTFTINKDGSAVTDLSTIGATVSWAVEDAAANKYKGTVSIDTSVAESIGVYTIDVAPYDYAGNTPSPALPSTNVFVIDAEAPDIAVQYRDNGTAADYAAATADEDYHGVAQDVKITVMDPNFDPAGEGTANVTAIDATVGVTDINGNDLNTNTDTTDDVDVAAIETAIESATGWTDVTESGVVVGKEKEFTALLSAEARYVISINATDLATNSTATADPVKTFTDNITVDLTKPVVEVSVKTEVIKRLLQAVTFGLYKADATATVTATDKFSPITEITFEGKVETGASSTNSDIAKVTKDATEITQDASDAGKASSEFDVPAQFRGFLIATATDSTNWTGEFTSSAGSANIDAEKSDESTEKVDGVIVDTVKPAFVSDEFSTSRYTDGVPYYGMADGTFTYTLVIEEANFNTNTVAGDILSDSVITIIDTEHGNADVTATINPSFSAWTAVTGEEDQYTITLTIPSTANSGRYAVKALIKDVIGDEDADNHVLEYTSDEFVIDTYAPEIVDFNFSTTGDYYIVDEADGDGSAKPAVAEDGVQTYEYYFQEAFTVKVNASDKTCSETATNSGVKDIVLIAYDIDKAQWVSVDKGAMDTSNECCDFTIQGPFKGNIYACAVDNLEQYPTLIAGSFVTIDSIKDLEANLAAGVEEKLEKLYDYDTTEYYNFDNFRDFSIFVAPNDSIIEGDDKHKEETQHIGFDLRATTETEMAKDSYLGSSAFVRAITDKTGETVYDNNADPTMDFTATEVPLYRSDVSVALDITDSYSGIRQIDWYVIGRDGQDTANNQNGTLTIDNSGTPSDDSWSISGEADSNLITNAQKTIVVSNNSNDIIVLVVLTDRAGNKSYDYTVLGIDKTDPVINVSYSDNNNRTGNYNDYYNHNRTATVTVKERNFDAARVVAAIKNTDPSYSYTPNISDITSLSAWSSDGDANDPTYTYKITYTDDGTFKFDIKVTDRAGRSSSKSEKEFTIDKTAPVITVDLSNSDVRNGRYFKADRTATITVVEHNFNSAEFENLIRATLNNSGITVPSVSSWSRNGDVNTATVTFSADGDYVLSFKYTDMAGNSDQTTDSDFSGVSPVDFTVDKTVPVIKLTGKNNNSAYKIIDSLMATETDNNCSDITITINFYSYRADHNSVEGQTFEFRGLHSLSEAVSVVEKFSFANDGLYEVTAKCIDMAGNESATDTVTFSKNEHGSVYVPSEDLSAILGKYSNRNDIQGKALYIDEYSLVPIEDNTDNYYLTINGKAQDSAYITRTELDDSPNHGWYHYRYTINAELITAEGEYGVYIRSVVINDGDSTEIENNAISNEGENRYNGVFYIDNTNPYVKIDGLEKHVNNRTTEKKVKLTVNETNLYYIYVEVTKSGASDDAAVIERHLWIDDSNNENKVSDILKVNGLTAEDGVIVESYNADGETLPVATFELNLNNSEKQDVTIKVADLAGNIAHEDEDFNRNDLFTDASSNTRSNYINGTEDSGIVLTQISLSKFLDIGQMIKDNKQIAIGILLAILVLIAIAILIPVVVKRRKRLEAEEAELDDEEEEE